MNSIGNTPAAPGAKAALIALASKEAAYIADWVFHHLRFGFDPLIVLVNRSDDATQEIVSQISRRDSRVRMINVDFLDKDAPYSNLRIQSDAYEFALETLRKEFSPDSYMFCFDVDEFWTPLDFETTILDYTQRHGSPWKCAFNWFLSTNEPHVFGPPFKPVNQGKHTVHLKSGFQIGQPVKSVRVHRVIDACKRPVHLATGTYLDATHNKTPEPPKTFGEAFLFHRIHRSVVEYMGLLGRTSPKGGALPFKRNRRGYHWYGKFAVSEQNFTVSADQLESYYTDFTQFLVQHDLGAMIHGGRKLMLERVPGVINDFVALSPEDQNKWVQIFDDIDFEQLSEMMLVASSDLEQLKGDLRLESFENG